MPQKNNPSRSKKRGHVRNADQSAANQAPEWVPEKIKWERAEYDGIKGSPPEWVPEPHRKEFYSASSLLFFLVEEKKATYAEIRSRFDYLVQNKYGGIVLALAKDTKPYDDELHHLVKLYQAISLGEIKGLRLLAGENAVAGFRVRTGYQKRKDFSDRPEVQRIAKAQWAANPNTTIKDIIYSPELEQYKYKERTLRNWISAVDPRLPNAKRGRPRTRK